ncbi:AraC family transcriptional regulator ligand-binding domain-containing protein (plasmid) [Burkholderia sp. FERM BP-3421]|uniref:AraC family transcriptional regulator ligand-binding domain-containing protein n=1 Tax=Burkholderia sp. FERM BP-3421 TaxID=1494466 RepID=UPI0023610B94|nr:AraC family transcriptional regulator ligand-binding domain-containing protein [Burkholderia sp. FERM BP-3421]WDD90260.1 AraC family transcriptional regulator ligand-binding domain-containing protein [Burkholderia sp. FERM BP-3421]
MQRTPSFGTDLASRRPAPLHTIIIALRVLERLGYSVTELLQGSGITEKDLTRPDLVVSHTQELIVFANALRVTGDESIGITIGQSIPVTAYGVRGHAMLVCPTLGAALRLGYSCPLLAISYFNATLHEVDGDAVVTISDYAYRADLHVLNTAMCASAYKREIVDLLQYSPDFKRVTFDFPKPGNADLYATLLGCDVVFDAGSTTIVFDAKHLSAPLAYFHEVEYELAKHFCEQRERELSAWKPEQLVTRALQHLYETRGVLSAQELAEKLGTSHRSMQRELERAGVSYRRLRDEVLQARAVEYQAHQALTSVKVRARELGYGSGFALKRAQARWEKR